MILFDLIQLLLDAQVVDPGTPAPGLPGSPGGGGGGGSGDIITCATDGALCPASSFTAIGAAFATQGYYVHADLIWYLTRSTFGLWAPMLYIMAAAAGMISLAMGMPPKMYLWFFFGPALYNWLLETKEQVHGVQWRVAGVDQDQRQVWKLSEVGLRNLNIKYRLQDTDGKNLNFSRDKPPTDPVEVAMVFIWFDDLVSSTVQWLTQWTGIYRQVGGDDGGGGNTAIIKRPSGSEEYDRWYLMSNLKWGLLENITSARLHSGDMRDAFVSFLSSECGDALAKTISKQNFVAASNSRSGRPPCSIFGTKDTSSMSRADEAQTCEDSGDPDYDAVTKALADVYIPIPRSLRSIWRDTSKGSYSAFFGDSGGLGGGAGGGGLFMALSSLVAGGGGGMTCPGPGCGSRISDHFMSEDNMNCADYLYFLINGFRWESGHIYHQLVRSAPAGMSDKHVIYNLFYGWDIRKGDEESAVQNEESPMYFLQNLVLLHLIRNEMAIAPKVVDSRFSSSVEDSQSYVEAYQRTVGSKAKYGEVYTWALMMPYIQGILLYVLAMGYPFACVLMVVPGWHRALFTWMSFWAWAKLWDVGFSIVTVIERSIWAMLGNSSTAQKVSSLVVGMEEKAKIKVDPCKIGTDGSSSDCPVVPSVTDADGEPEWEKILSLFDRAMVLGANMDLDLANAYYIYIMAALYFSVPAVTGQLVLGAKAGAAGMVSNMIGGVASEGGRAAGQGFTGLLGKHAGANAATVGQEGYAKAMRKSGLGLQAVNSGNLGLESALAGAEAQTQGQNLGLIASNKDRATQTYQTQANAAAALGALRSGMVGNPLAHGMLSLLNKGGLRPISMPDSAIGHLKPKSDGKGVKAAPGASGATGGSEGATGSIGFLGGLWGQTHQILGEAGRVGATLVSADAVANTNAALAGYNAQQGQINLNSFGQNTAREGFGMAERRVGAQADFDAQQSAWGARRDFANQTAGYLGALGMDTSFLGPGPKPQDMTGMAMSGMLGASATRSAHFANPQTGAFWGMRDATFNNLYSGFGPGRIQSAYTSTSFGEAARDVEDGLNYTWGTYKGGNIGGTKLPSE